jgi:quinol monooxygenase YgiN
MSDSHCPAEPGPAVDSAATSNNEPVDPAVEEPGDVDPVMVVLAFQTDQADQLSSVLAQYVVVSRHHPGCRNIDFVASATRSGRLLLIEKWDSMEAQRAHFDSPEMVEMAHACIGLLTQPPDIDLFQGVSMHDLA